MCGIFGVLGQDLSLNQLYQSFLQLKKRGPDRSNITISNDYYLGFHRLALNCLDINGDQPFVYKDDEYSYYVLINGEIYNYKQLQKKYNINNITSDCSIIYPLFKQFNKDFVKLNREINGEYALVIVELFQNQLHKLYISNDEMSVRPLFWVNNEQHFGFSSTLKSLYMLNVFKDDIVHRLNQSQYIIYNYKTKELEINKYHIKNENYNLDTLQLQNRESNELTKILINCVKKRLFTDRDFGCLLSGGVDSSLVCAIASMLLYEQDKNKKLYTFTIGMSENSTDIKYAEMVVQHLNNKYNNIVHKTVFVSKEQMLNSFDDVLEATNTYDITTNRASVPQYLISKYIYENTNVRCILNGDGSDELFGSYLYFHNYPNLLEFQKETYKLLDNIHYFDGLRVDRSLSFNGLEARVPFLDIEFVDYVRGLNVYHKIPKEYNGKKMEKYLLRQSFNTHYPDLLPEMVLFRTKEAFSDGVSEINNSWYMMVKNYFNDKVSDEEFDIYLKDNNDFVLTKEAYYYWKHHKSNFNNNFNTIPYYWMPNWSNNNNEPSARVLNVYNN